jgi:hypothetical protein
LKENTPKPISFYSIVLLLFFPAPGMCDGGLSSIGVLIFLGYIVLAFPAFALVVTAFILKNRSKRLKFISNALIMLVNN